MDAAAALLRDLGGGTAPRARATVSTGREQEVLGLIALGMSNGRIAGGHPMTTLHHRTPTTAPRPATSGRVGRRLTAAIAAVAAGETDGGLSPPQDTSLHD